MTVRGGSGPEDEEDVGRPHQKNLRTGRWSEEGRAYALTKCATGLGLLTENPLVAECVMDSLFFLDRDNRIILGAFVVMPDHFHAIAIVMEGYGLSGIMNSLGSFTSRRINQILERSGPVWQRGFYDRAIRRTEDVKAACEYVHYNPVRRDLVHRAEDWPYSSLNPRYYGRIKWDRFS